MVLVTCCSTKCERSVCSGEFVMRQSVDDDVVMKFDGKLLRCFKGNKKPKYCIGIEMEKLRYKVGG